MKSQYLVVSDLHICDVEEHDDGWKAYKSRRFSIDEEFAALLRSAIARAAPDGKSATLTLVLNGDIIDFDLVNAVPERADFPISRFERKRGLLPTEDKSAWKLGHVLEDHPVFVEALAAFLSAGHRVVYVLGNHDRELHFPAVQQVLRNALADAAAANGGDAALGTLDFEPWFFYVPGEIYAEHGQQYDHYSTFRYVLSPVVKTKDGPIIALPMGDLANRYLMSLMGFFNPHASDFILNVFHYAAHWLRNYAFTRRSILWNWFWGSILVLGQLLTLKKRIHRRPPDYDARLAQLSSRSGLSVGTLNALGELQPAPITTRFYRIARELWIDRLLIAVLMATGTIALAFSPSPLWVKLMVPLSSFPLLYFVYEWLAKGDTIFTVEHEVPCFARRVAALVGVKVVTFGHTHRPRIIPLDAGCSFVDTGTWAPIVAAKGDQPRLAPGYRNYLWLCFDDGDVSMLLDVWKAPPALSTASARLKLAS